MFAVGILTNSSAAKQITQVLRQNLLTSPTLLRARLHCGLHPRQGGGGGVSGGGVGGGGGVRLVNNKCPTQRHMLVWRPGADRECQYLILEPVFSWNINIQNINYFTFLHRLTNRTGQIIIIRL